MSETRYPLSWPEGWKRTTRRTKAKFGRDAVNFRRVRLTISDGVKRILGELYAMRVREGDAIISTNCETRLDGLPYSASAEPSDPGVAVYWKDRNGRKKCMAIDQYDRVADNAAAIAATLSAMRAIERHGGAEILERTFLGFAQLPERAGVDWRKVLGVREDVRPTRELIDELFRQEARGLHPDVPGGDHDRFVELNAARQAAILELNL